MKFNILNLKKRKNERNRITFGRQRNIMSHSKAIQKKATENGNKSRSLPNVYVKPCGNYTNMDNTKATGEL